MKFPGKIFLSGNRKLRSYLFLLLLVVLLPVTILGVKTVQELRQHAAGTGAIDFSTLNFIKLYGQTDFKDVMRNYTNGLGMYHGAGVHVDKSSTPNRVYVVDTGNNRILGYKSIGTCSQNTAQACTANSDCGAGNSCTVTGSKQPDIVIGQPDLLKGNCNQDGNLGVDGPVSASTICMGYANNTAENWMRVSIDTDSQGNLYVPDADNNRVLKYNSPLTTDSVADFVLGQDTFSTNGPNRGANYTFPAPDDHSLRLNYGPPDNVSSRGVSVDPQNNVWVSDTFNNRILRFPPNGKNANLVLGQSSFTATGCTTTLANSITSLTAMCSPTLARVNPTTGELYVVDEWPHAFHARILVFTPPFTNGMAATRILIPKQPLVTDPNNPTGPKIPFYNAPGGIEGNGYYLQVTGLEFNPLYSSDPIKQQNDPYAKGVIWVNEHQTYRTVLLSDTGDILKVIGAPNANYEGGDTQYRSPCPSIYAGYHLWWPGGSIGFDSDNNIYLADAQFHRISRYSLPYNTYISGTATCLPEPNGGLFPGTLPNVSDQERVDVPLLNTLLGSTDTASRLGESVGLTIFQNQLIVEDERGRMKIWNNYLTKPNGSKPDFVMTSHMPSRIWFGNAIDDSNRLWMYDEQGQLRIQQLPFTQSDQPPVKENIKLYWADDPNKVPFTYKFSETGITFDKVNKALYISDLQNQRVFRIKNYSNFNDPAGLAVDMVIGQPNKTSITCSTTPNATTLCSPHQLQFDKKGNLYVVENTYECHGNDRIVMYSAASLAAASGMFPNIAASKVYVAPSLTQKGPCAYNTINQPGSPITMAFTSTNQMVVGNDGYYGDITVRPTRQLWFYNDPINKQTPDGFIPVPMGTPGELVIDSQDNLFIQDHTWYKVWGVNPGIDPSLLVSLSGSQLQWGAGSTSPIPTTVATVPPSPTSIQPSPTSVILTLTPTRTPTPIPSSTPVPSPTPTPQPNSTKVGVTLFLHGVGKGGDNVNLGSTGNLTPVHTSRPVTLTLLDGSQTVVKTAPGNVIYNSTSGNFTGTVDLGTTLPTGAYTVRIKSPSFIEHQVGSSFFTLSQGQTTQLTPTYLVAGDANNDNHINILDYNLMLDCYSVLTPPKNCDSTKLLQTDFNDDNAVNQFDYNLFLRELSDQGV